MIPAIILNLPVYLSKYFNMCIWKPNAFVCLFWCSLSQSTIFRHVRMNFLVCLRSGIQQRNSTGNESRTSNPRIKSNTLLSHCALQGNLRLYGKYRNWLAIKENTNQTVLSELCLNIQGNYTIWNKHWGSFITQLIITQIWIQHGHALASKFCYHGILQRNDRKMTI